jgi:hypothetical protein
VGTLDPQFVEIGARTQHTEHLKESGGLLIHLKFCRRWRHFAVQRMLPESEKEILAHM